MLLTDTKSVIKFLDIEVLEEIASEFVRDKDVLNRKKYRKENYNHSEWQKQNPIVEQIKEYWFEEAEEKLGNATAIQLLQEIDFQAIADCFEEKHQKIVDAELEQKIREDEGWSSGTYYVDEETGAVEERF